MQSSLPELPQGLSKALNEFRHVQLTRIDYCDKCGRVVLRGSADSFFEKQVVQETLRRVDGVRSIDNRLSVHWGKNRAAKRDSSPAS